MLTKSNRLRHIFTKHSIYRIYPQSGLEQNQLSWVMFWKKKKDMVDTTAAVSRSSPAGNANSRFHLAPPWTPQLLGASHLNLKALLNYTSPTAPRSFSALRSVQLASNQKKSRICGTIEIISISLIYPTTKALTYLAMKLQIHTRYPPKQLRPEAKSVQHL